VPTYIYFKVFAFQYLAFNSILVVCFSKFFLFLNLFILHSPCLVKSCPFFYNLFGGECEFLFNDFNKYTFEDSDDWDKPKSFLAPMEFKRRLFNYLDNLTRLNHIGEGMQRGKKDEGN
jgi:hypothetical protein